MPHMHPNSVFLVTQNYQQLISFFLNLHNILGADNLCMCGFV